MVTISPYLQLSSASAFKPPTNVRVKPNDGFGLRIECICHILNPSSRASGRPWCREHPTIQKPHSLYKTLHPHRTERLIYFTNQQKPNFERTWRTWRCHFLSRKEEAELNSCKTSSPFGARHALRENACEASTCRWGRFPLSTRVGFRVWCRGRSWSQE